MPSEIDSRITLQLSLPCPLNRYYQASGFKIVKTQRARQCRDIVADEVCQQLGGKPEPMIGPIGMQYTIHPSTDGRVTAPDIDAYEKGLLDAFTKVGIWGDDKQVKEISKSLSYPIGKGQLLVDIWEL